MTARSIKIRRSNFAKGMARALDLGSTINLYDYNSDSQEMDCMAIRSDWEMVGEDIILAINNYKSGIHGTKRNINS